MIMNVLSASKDALEVILASQSRDSLPHSAGWYKLYKADRRLVRIFSIFEASNFEVYLGSD